MNRVDLEPCPFCGGPASTRERQDEDLWSHNIVTWTRVGCPDCEVWFEWPPGADPDAAAEWNTRALAPQAGGAVAWRYRMPNMPGAHWMMVLGDWPADWGVDWEREPLYLHPASLPSRVREITEEMVEAAARKLATLAFARVSTADEAAAKRICDKGWIIYQDDARAALQAALASTPPPASMPEAEGWQDIETAPRGRKVLVAYRNELGNWRIVTARHYTDLSWDQCSPEPDHGEFAPEGWYEESDSADVLCLTSCPPTHWRHLPAPPLPAKGGPAND